MPLSPDLPGSEYYRITLGTIAAAVLVAYVVGREDSSHPILRSRLFTYFGKVSYGIYVLHTIVLGYVASLAAGIVLPYGADHLLAMIVYLVIAVTLAGLSFKFFEAPILRVKARFARV